MRWVYLILIIVFVAALIIFGAQNLQTATMSFLGFSVSAPLVVLPVIVYVLGAVTGGSLYALLRKSVRESKGVVPSGSGLRSGCNGTSQPPLVDPATRRLHRSTQVRVTQPTPSVDKSRPRRSAEPSGAHVFDERQRSNEKA